MAVVITLFKMDIVKRIWRRFISQQRKILITIPRILNNKTQVLHKELWENQTVWVGGLGPFTNRV